MNAKRQYAENDRITALYERLSRDDDLQGESNEFAPFINIMSEWYSKDISRKIKTAAYAKGNAGKPTSNNVIYGFMKDPQNKDNWLIDEYAADIVKRIFQMTLNGIGPYQIARILTEEKIEKPSVYFAKNRIVGQKPPKRDLSEPYNWCGTTIINMLKKPEYAGHTVNFRTTKEHFKDRQSKCNSKENWKIFENTHPAIIDQVTFDTVQKLRGTPRKVNSCGESNPLTGLVFCYECGSKMYNSRYADEYYIEKRHGKEYRRKHADSYSCSAYELGNSAFKKKCTKHFIRTCAIQELVLDSIRKISDYVRENEAEFIEKILIHEADKSSGERVQQVDIYFSFIGNFSLPDETAPTTEEELAAKEKLLRKRANQRAANQRFYAKKKAEHNEKMQLEKELQTA